MSFSSLAIGPAFARSGRFWIAIAAVAAVVLVRMSGLGELLSLDALNADRKALVTWVGAHGMLAATVYVLIYIAAVAFSLPGAVYLTLTGGFLFGAAFGTLLTLVGATTGATIVFLFAKILFGDRVVSGLGTRYPTLVQAVRDHAWSYLLALRFVPLFPFFLVNLIAAFVGVRLSTYVATTIVGILPGTAVFSLSGAGLGTILEQGHSVSAGSIMTPTVIAALIGLGALSLVAIPIRKRFGKLKVEESLPSRDGNLPVCTEILQGPAFSDASGSAAVQAREFNPELFAPTATVLLDRNPVRELGQQARSSSNTNN